MSYNINLLTSAFREDERHVRDLPPEEKKAVIMLRGLILNDMHHLMKNKKMPEEYLNFMGEKTLPQDKIQEFSESNTKKILQMSMSNALVGDYGKDIKRCADPSIYGDPGFRAKFCNLISRALTPVMPAVSTLATGMLTDTHYLDLAESIELEIPSNEIPQWNDAAVNTRSSGSKKTYDDVIILNPKVIEREFSINWLQLITGKVSLPNLMLSMALGFQSYKTARFASALAEGVAGLTGSDMIAQTMNIDNIIAISDNVKGKVGNSGDPIWFGRKKALSKMYPDPASYGAMVVGIADEWCKTGFASGLLGYQLIELDNVINPKTINSNLTKPLFKDNEAYCFAYPATSKPIQEAWGGQLMQFVENPNETANYTTNFTARAWYDSKFIQGKNFGAITEIS